MDPGERFRRFCVQSGIEERVGSLVGAIDYSNRLISDARDFLNELVPRQDGLAIDVVVFGSYARREASIASDFDYLVVPFTLPTEARIRLTREMLEAVNALKARVELKDPGGSGLFGNIQSASDLVERIGLEQDTNATHSRRCLLLQESVSIYAPDCHRQLLRSILARYLADYGEPKKGPPRFLLNDLHRYWYTIAVDYQAKRWERLDVGWGIRYLKMLITRRLSYVGAILPPLACSDSMPATIDHLSEAYSMTALDRIASLADWDKFTSHDALSELFIAANEFNEAISDPDKREHLSRVSASSAPGENQVFDDLKTLTKDVDKMLRAIFADPALCELVHRYMIL